MATETPEEAESVSGSGKLSEETAEKLRFEDQCFLTDAIRFFASKNKRVPYKNFIVLDADAGADAASLVSKVNSRFGSTGKGLRAFLSMTPAEFATLVPKIRLYVIKYRNKDDGKGMQQELVFPDWTGKHVIENIMKTATGRGDGAGISKFSYEFDGRDPATTENLIKASVTISFTDFEVLAKPLRGLTKVEKEYFGENKENAEPRYLDLVTRYTPDNPAAVFTKLKASIGWQPPSDESGVVIREELKEFISEGYANMDLILYMTGHDLTFKENGRVDLKVDFRAALENLMSGRQADILALDGGRNQKDIDKEFKEKKEKKKASIDEATEDIEAHRRVEEAEDDAQGWFDSDSAKERAARHLKERAEDKLEAETEALRLLELEHNVMRERLRVVRYKKLLDDLNKSNKIRFMDVAIESLEKWYMDNESRDATSKTRFTATKAILEGDGQSASIPEIAGQKDNPAAKGAQAAREYQDELDKKLKEEDHEKMNDLKENQNTPEVPSGFHRIYYIYLGDIINVAAEVLERADKWQGITRLVTGPVQFDDPNTADPKTIVENMADIPIALNTFVEWYYQKVIVKARDIYPLKDFLKDVMTDLVYRSLGEQCFQGLSRMPAFTLTPMIFNMSIDGTAKVEPVKKDTATGFYPRLTVNQFAKKVKNNLRSDVSNTVTYIFMTAIFKNENTFNDGNISKDEKDGVYHFGIGRDRGIINTIKFKKVQMNYRKEALVLDQGNLGTGQLREVYDADIKMVGNTLFRNGQYLYIDPSTMGVSTKTAQELGMGGYYVITKVDGELSADGYETSLTCKYNSKKRKTGKLKSRTSSPDVGPPAPTSDIDKP
tara:strand:- start:811 stop:3321 length:2511 start_codon:yes stop_codon:yes gene_type:complete